MKKTLALALSLSCVALGVQAQSNDTLKKIKDSGSVTMGVRESSGALSFTLGDGKFAGYHIEICEKVIADVRRQLGMSSLVVKYQPVTSQNRIPLVQNGNVDIECGSTTNNATRQKDVSFAVTTFVEEVRIAVKANSGISGINQLAGKAVHVVAGSRQEMALHEILQVVPGLAIATSATRNELDLLEGVARQLLKGDQPAPAQHQRDLLGNDVKAVGVFGS